MIDKTLADFVSLYRFYSQSGLGFDDLAKVRARSSQTEQPPSSLFVPVETAIRLACVIFGASPHSPFLYSRTKGECEAAISALGFTTLVILRPSFLLGARSQERTAEKVAQRIGQFLRPVLVGPLRKYVPVEAFTVARMLARAAATAPVGVTIIESDAIL